METPILYHCTICNAGFNTKLERKNHFRQICQVSIKLTDLEGNIQIIDRIDGTFKCIKCGTQYNRSDNLAAHWKRCQRKAESSNNPSILRYLN